VFDEDRRGWFVGRRISEGIFGRKGKVDASAQYAIDGGDGAFEISCEACDVLSMFGEGAWNEGSFADGVDDTWGMPWREIVIVKGCDCARAFIARDGDAITSFGIRIWFFRAVEASTREHIGNDVSVAFFE
jgi:hypothetical protein